MKAIVFGASGATGKLVVQQLVKRNIPVRIVVRASAIIPVQFSDDKRIEIAYGNINDFDAHKIKDLVMKYIIIKYEVLFSTLAKQAGYFVSLLVLFVYPVVLI